jgi:hypothetical protein
VRHGKPTYRLVVGPVLRPGLIRRYFGIRS